MTISGYEFKDLDLIKAALTHKSYANEVGATQKENPEREIYNERLEFLGDAILGLIVAEYLFHKFPDMPEGDLTKLRAQYVCERNLAEAARRMRIGDLLILGRGEDSGGGRTRDSILSDTYEAVLAAVYKDGGMEPCLKLVEQEILRYPPKKEIRDAKSQLQEILQSQNREIPIYRVIRATGPDHLKHFTVEVVIDGKRAATGEGSNKKAAEMAAAERAIGVLGVK